MTTRRTPVSPSITPEVMTVTPAMARNWLASNDHNRHLRGTVVAAYARDMAEGKWALNGEAIKIATDGTLLDGQHRLHAVTHAGVAVPMLVVRGVEAATQDTMDSGIGRKFADQLNLNGEAAPQILAAILRKITLWEIGVYTKASGKLKPTFAEMSDTLARYPDARNCALFGTKRAGASSIHASTIGFALWLLSSRDYDRALWFLERVSDGVGLNAGHPVLVLRERIRRERDTTHGDVSSDVVLALIVCAWNVYRAGRSVQKIQLPPGSLSNETFPQPK